MAVNDKRFPPRPTGMPYQYPGGPWSSMLPPHHKEDGKWPRPPMPWRNDTELAIELHPWEECCGGEDPCMCITSGEVAKWNDVHDLVSANSASWGGEYDDSWKNSAELWEGASEIVQEHSAYWDSLEGQMERRIAEVAVQTDWDQGDSSKLDFLKNKPIPITSADIDAIFI